MPPLSEQALEDFFTWLAEQYGIEPTLLQLPEFAIRFGNKENEFYRYWAEFIYPQSASAKAGQPAPPPQPEQVTPQPAFNLPETIKIGDKDIPVNYRVIDQFQQTIPELDENGEPVLDEEGNEIQTERIVSLYTPVVPIADLTPEALDTISQNIFGVADNGQVLNENQPFTRSQLGNIITFDPLTGKSDLTELRKLVAEASILDFAQTSGINLTPDLEARIAEISQGFPAEGLISVDALREELSRFDPSQVDVPPGEVGFGFDPLAEQKLAQARQAPAFRREEQRIQAEQFAREEQRTLAQAGAFAEETPGNILTRLAREAGISRDEFFVRFGRDPRVRKLLGGASPVFSSERLAPFEAKVKEEEVARQKQFEALKKRARQARVRPQRVGRI